MKLLRMTPPPALAPAGGRGCFSSGEYLVQNVLFVSLGHQHNLFRRQYCPDALRDCHRMLRGVGVDGVLIQAYNRCNDSHLGIRESPLGTTSTTSAA